MWSFFDDDDDDDVPLSPRLQKLNDILQDYTKVSTIAGITFLKNKQSSLARIFWGMIFIGLLLLAIYGSYMSYRNWNEDPVILTSSISIPLRKFPFPGVVFCNEGRVLEPYGAAIVRTVQEKLSEANITFVHVSPFSIVGSRTFANALYNFNIMDVLVPFPNPFQTLPNKNMSLESQRKFIEQVFSQRANQLLHIWSEVLPRIGPIPSKLWNSNDSMPLQWLLNKVLHFSYRNIDAFLKVFSKQLNPNVTMDLFSVLPLYFEPNSKVTEINYDADIKLLNVKSILKVLLPWLWYSYLPCYDIIDLTADEMSKRTAFLKNCKWKGKSIPCAAIFRSVPTDAGMCCSFNTASAEDIFVSSGYSEIISTLQNKDKIDALENSTIPDWFLQGTEPISRQGLKRGLQVTLDAHTNLYDFFSKNSDFDSFSFLILPKNDFPLVKYKGNVLKRGYHSYIAVSGTSLTTDSSLRQISPKYRKCLFDDEYHLNLFKSYSQANCLFECLLDIAKDQTMQNAGLSETCTPWYFPSAYGDDLTCLPHVQKILQDIFGIKLNPFDCTECLPDCNTEIYEYKFSNEPFRECDDLNFRATPLCNPESNSQDVSPFLWWNYFNYSEIFLSFPYQPTYYKFPLTEKNTKYRQANYQHSVSIITNFDNTANIYNAYRKDIATVSVFFEDDTVFGFSAMPSSNWGLQLSYFGGWFGLLISFSICSLVELFFLFLRILYASFI